MEFTAASRRRADDAHRDLSVAYHVAVLGSLAMAGKLPSLESLMAQLDHTVGVKSAHARRAELERLGAHIGVPVRPATREARFGLKKLMRAVRGE